MAALQVQEALKLLHGMPVAAGTALVLQRCRQPVLFDPAAVSRRLPEPRNVSRAGRAAAGAAEHGRASFSRPSGRTLAGPLRLVLDRELVVAIECPRCSLARRGDAAACQGQGVRGDLPELPASRPGPSSPARSRKIRRWRPSRFPASAFRLTISCGSTGRPSRGSSSWPRTGGECETGLGNRPLSGDEITFGEMKVREPERRQRPDRDRQVRLPGLRGPGAGRPADLPRSPRRRRHRAPRPLRYVRRAGGILLGKECLDQADRPAVRLDHPVARGQALRQHPGQLHLHPRFVGRNHPRARPAVSRFRHRGLVSHASQLRDLPVAPRSVHSPAISSRSRSRWPMSSTRSTRRAVFSSGATAAWRRSAGYYLTADRGDRIALARLVNDLEQLPNSEGGSGGTFSPRLEAELIKMLTRPASS